jgi:hypothetical protein
MLPDLGAAEPDESRRELIDDVTPRHPRDTLRELGDHELPGDEKVAGIPQARRHLVLGREERAGW